MLRELHTKGKCNPDFREPKLRADTQSYLQEHYYKETALLSKNHSLRRVWPREPHSEGKHNTNFRETQFVERYSPALEDHSEEDIDFHQGIQI